LDLSVFYFIVTGLVVIANGTADILLALFTAVPFGLAGPVYVACLAAINL